MEKEEIRKLEQRITILEEQMLRVKNNIPKIKKALEEMSDEEKRDFQKLISSIGQR